MRNMKFCKTVILFLAFCFIFNSCSFFSSFSDSEADSGIKISGLTMSKNQINVSVGEMTYITVNIKPSEVQKDVKLVWSYDSNIITADTSSAWGVTITGVKEGQTNLKCSYDGYEATCIVSVKGYAENYEESVDPYIYSNTTIIQTSPGVTEKVFCSLYGGTAADIDGYSWSIDNPSVASIEPTGQYCVVTAKDSGYARIKITHKKASYPYYMGIYVFADATAVSYITTSHNILTMNMEETEKTISVSLVNGSSTSSDDKFNWQILEDTSLLPIKYETNGNKAVVTPVKGGSCTLRVTHPDAAYPLDILCRVISVVKSVYIEPESTVITLTGSTEQTLKSSLKNTTSGEYNVDAFTYTLDDCDVAEIVGWVGNEVMLKGKANGSCKLIITHEKAAYAREVLLIVNGQLTNAVDSSCYITTTQNYIRTKVGAEGTYLNISLKGGNEGDEAGFIWSIKSTAVDGSANDVISMDTSHGTPVYSRAASLTYAYGKAFIEPNYEGTAIISISHPKVAYPTEILVKVLNKDAVLEEPLYFVGDGLIRMLNGSAYDYTVELKGKNKASIDDNNIQWSCDNSAIKISASANIANLTAPVLGSGNTISNLTIRHNKADADKKVMILTADTEEELANMKALYSDKLYYNLEIGETAYCLTNYVGFDSKETRTDENGNEIEVPVSYDFSTASWTVNDSSVCSVEKLTENPLTGIVTAKKAGRTNVSVNVTDNEGKTYTCKYEITVYPLGSVQTEPEVYFTTTQNVINLSKAGNEQTVYVSAINLSSSKYSGITWASENEGIAKVIGNGNSATVTALAEGETVISVSHEDSQNTLKIYVRIGSEYIIPETEPVVYISSTDVITMLKDGAAQRLDAVLVNYSETDKTGFTFSIDNESIATISTQSTNGIAYIKPVESGQTEITIRHPKSALDRKVLVVVGNSSEELAAFTYLTTSTNVVAVGEGNTKTVSVSVKNTSDVVLNGYTWSSSDPGIISVVSQGATAVLTGNSIGTAMITVANPSCTYPLQIIAQCVDPIAASASPYIQLTSSVITVNVNSNYTSVSADLIGGSEGDFSDFVWTSSDPSVCTVYGQNEVGKIKALKEGTAYITVSHPKAAYSAQLLCVCDKVVESECYINVPSSIITMKPTDSSQTITASLVNGASTDKYNFTWSLDVYDVIDFVYSANVCTITPLQQGQATVTIHHPKSAYDQQIVVTVQEYSTFAFPDEYLTITQGTVNFETMQIPNTKVSTHVEYSTSNAEICKIEGTKSTAQITAINAGTANVYAKLVANSTGVVQASAEMMVYVKEAPVNACYITSSTTIYTVNKGKSQTLSASITGSGIVTSDQQNLKWSTSDTDIISIAGINSNGTVTGQSIYITANKSGEALITCSHEKAASNLQFYIVVPGSADKAVTLNKSYITLTKGSSGSALKATIENAESSNDYNDLIWTVSNAGQEEVCRVMGSGQNVTIYPVNVGEAEVMAQLPDSKSVAKCTVLVQAGKSFVLESTSATVQPFGTKKVKYTVSPANANLTWTMNQSDDFFTYRDLGCDANGVGYVEIEGLKEGSGNLYCVTDGNAKGNLQVRVAWNYKFAVKGNTSFNIKPTETVSFDYTVSPANAEIVISSPDLNTVFNATVQKGTSSDDGVTGTGKIIINPITETGNNIRIDLVAKNKANDSVIGSQTLTGYIRYSSNLTPKITSTSNLKGKWSHLENDNIKLGDGEQFTVQFGIVESKINGTISSIKFQPTAGVTGITGSENLQDKSITLIHSTDQTAPYDMYLIKHLYYASEYPDYHAFKWQVTYHSYTSLGTKYYSDYIRLMKPGTENDFKPQNYECYWYHDDGGDSKYPYKITVTNNGVTTAVQNYTDDESKVYTLVEDTSKRNTYMSVSDFRNNPWLYCPGTIQADGDINFTYQDIVSGKYKNGEYGTNDKVNVAPHIMTNHVDCELVTFQSTDTTNKGGRLLGTIVISITHNGKSEPNVAHYNVYEEVRDCLCTYRP